MQLDVFLKCVICFSLQKETLGRWNLYALEHIFYLVMLFNVFQALVSSEAVYIGSLLFRGNIHPLKKCIWKTSAVYSKFSPCSQWSQYSKLLMVLVFCIFLFFFSDYPTCREGKGASIDCCFYSSNSVFHLGPALWKMNIFFPLVVLSLKNSLVNPASA